MTKYTWDAIPIEYKWVAKDSDGMIEAYSERPILREYDWHSSGLGSTAVLGYSRPWESDDDWMESLEERPKPRQRYELSDSGGILDTSERNWMDLPEVVDRLNYYEELLRR